MNDFQRLTVSEPWDFKNKDNVNVLYGRILRKIDAENLLFESNEIVSLGGASSNILILSTRYEDDRFEEKPYQGTVNGGLVSSDYYASMSAEEIKSKAIFVLIGSLDVDP